MVLEVLKHRLVGDIQQDFAQTYPFLRIDFFKNVNGKQGAPARQKISKGTKLSGIGILRDGELEISDKMTVGELEKTFFDLFGINVQVSRRSGPVWLETTVTDSWTLQQQNEHGRELSIPASNTLPGEDERYDQ